MDLKLPVKQLSQNGYLERPLMQKVHERGFTLLVKVTVNESLLKKHLTASGTVVHIFLQPLNLVTL